MKVFPLIYSRILKDDYPNGFLVRPGDLDVPVALKYVIPAIENITHVGGIRHAVFAVGGYLIYGGVACIAGKLVERILRSRIIDFPYEEFQADKTGRPLIFFIGFAVHREELVRNELPEIDLYGTYKIYLNYLVKQWRNDRAVTETSEGLDLNTRLYEPQSAPSSLSAGEKRILRDYHEDDFQKVIDCYFACMAWGPGGDFSFLSNVLPDDAPQSPFAHISLYNCSAEEYVRNKIGVQNRPASRVSSVERRGTGLPTNNLLNQKIATVTDDSAAADAKPSSGEKKSTRRPAAA